MDVIRFGNMVVRDLTDAIERMSDNILGGALDHNEYRYQTGYLKGLISARRSVNDIIDRLLAPEKTSTNPNQETKR